MVDIDGFKQINDEYGHRVGDKVLRTLAKTIKGSLRPLDNVARYDGEEFMIILPQTDRLGACSSGERVRRLVEAKKIEIDRETVISCTISAGLAVFPTDGDTDEKLIAAADQALYLAKKAGKNVVREYRDMAG